VRREMMRRQYTSLEYLLAKVLAELPLTLFFAAVFSTSLKLFTGLATGWGRLTAAYGLLGVGVTALGLAAGAWLPTSATDSGQLVSIVCSLPVLMVLMATGTILDVTHAPAIVRRLKRASPFGHCVDALVLSEFGGVTKFGRKSLLSWPRRPRFGGLARAKTGDDVVRLCGLSSKTFGACMRSLVLVSLANLVISYLGMVRHEEPAAGRTRRRKRMERLATAADACKSRSRQVATLVKFLLTGTVPRPATKRSLDDLLDNVDVSTSSTADCAPNHPARR